MSFRSHEELLIRIDMKKEKTIMKKRANEKYDHS